MLMLGAASASMVVTIRPALAQTAGIGAHLRDPDSRPKRAEAGSRPTDAGAANTAGAFQPPVRPLKGEEVRTVMARGGTYKGASYEQSQAYTNYIRRLQNGMSGFTCYASLQMPRR
jgi:hypothetical protein